MKIASVKLVAASAPVSQAAPVQLPFKLELRSAPYGYPQRVRVGLDALKESLLQAASVTQVKLAIEELEVANGSGWIRGSFSGLERDVDSALALVRPIEARVQAWVGAGPNDGPPFG